MSIDFYLYVSFYFTYVLLLTTGTVTLIEALRTEEPLVRHVMNLETVISLVAGYFYGKFIQEIEDEKKNFNKNIDWSKLVVTRYQDWCISTPLMLLTLCIVLGMNTGKTLTLPEYLIIIVCNYAMLLCGYFGETKRLSKLFACCVGFLFFKLLFFYIYYIFIYKRKYVVQNYLLYSYYFFVWSLYGCVFMFQEKEKNLCFNMLDFMAKCFIGLVLWAYYIDIFSW